MSLLEKLLEYLRSLTSAQLARVASFFLAPVLALGLAGSDLTQPGLGTELDQPLALVELNTSISPSGDIQARHGIVAILEPSELQFWIPLETTGKGEVWTSVEPDLISANRDRLVVDENGFGGRLPLIGIADPVVVVADGAAKGELKLPGRSTKLVEWKLASRRSVSLVSTVLLSCIFSLGAAMALAQPTRPKV